MIGRFFAPEKSSGYFIEKMLVDACSHHFKKKSEHDVVRYRYRFNFFDLRLYSDVVFIVFNFIMSLNDIEKIVHYRIRGVNIGRVAYAAALTNFKIYNRKYLLYYSLFRQLIIALRALSLAKNIIDQSEYYDDVVVYLRDIAYIDAVMFDYFMLHSIGVYTSSSPHGLMYYNDNKLSSIKIRAYPYPKINITDEQYNEFMMGRIGNPHDYIVYYSPDGNDTDFKDMEYMVRSLNGSFVVLIYAHSFTDAQLFNGYDGFINLYQWLSFTVDELNKLNVKIVIKGHPNFWAVGYLAGVIEWDKIVWAKVKEKYSNNPNVIFIDKPVDNGVLLSRMDTKKTVVVSHHSSAIPEAAYMGFNSISSICSPWGDDYYNFSNTWSTRNEYSCLLDKIKNLKPSDPVKLKNFISDRFYYDRDYSGGEPWWVVMAGEANISVTDLVKKPTLIKKNMFADYSSSVEKVAMAIGEF